MEHSPFSKAQPVTLTQFILSTQQKNPNATGNLTILLHSIEIAVKFISSRVGAAGIFDLYGLDGNVNVQGEEVKKLDVLSNEAFITALRRSRKVCVMVSEENADPIIVEGSDGTYTCVFDPLDGSSNIDANVSIGTIFGIYHRESAEGQHCTADVLQRGTSLCAAGYAVYGSATLLVLSLGDGVHAFTLDRTVGEFILTNECIQIPRRGKIYSINEGNAKFWDEPTRRYVHGVKFPEGDKAQPYSLRYVGSMVADVHRTMVYGGIFAYPGDVRAPSGKLRLLYEANPMAFLMEQAGGRATTGTQRILEVEPKNIHQRVPVFIGSPDDVADLENEYRKGK